MPSCCFLEWNIDVLIFKLPTVRDISISTHMTFVYIIKFNVSFGIKVFKFLQRPFLACVKLR